MVHSEWHSVGGRFDDPRLGKLSDHSSLRSVINRTGAVLMDEKVPEDCSCGRVEAEYTAGTRDNHVAAIVPPKDASRQPPTHPRIGDCQSITAVFPITAKNSFPPRFTLAMLGELWSEAGNLSDGTREVAGRI